MNETVSLNETASRDDQVLDRRVEGESFAAIAKALGFERAQDANEAFNRALRRRPDAERDELRQAEVVRLDTMAERIRVDDSLSAEDVQRLLRAVEQLRAMLLEK